MKQLLTVIRYYQKDAVSTISIANLILFNLTICQKSEWYKKKIFRIKFNMTFPQHHQIHQNAPIHAHIERKKSKHIATK